MKRILTVSVPMVIIFMLITSFVFAGTIQLPKTGQTKCIKLVGGPSTDCAGTGQDGEFQAGVAWPDVRFVLSGECIMDNLTGLMWHKKSTPKTNWNDALAYVTQVNGSGGLCGFSDWRLPNINELKSLSNDDVSMTASWLNTKGFDGLSTVYSCYWSSTTRADQNGSSWVVDYTWKNLFNYLKMDSSCNSLLVRAGQSGTTDSLYSANIAKTGQKISYAPKDDGDLQKGVAWPIPRFSDKADGTILDNLTGLTWMKDARPSTTQCSSVSKSFEFIECLNSNGYLGFSDWRLPNWKELDSLIDYSNKDLALPTGHPFINFQANFAWYWTSTLNLVDLDFWSIDMELGWAFSRDSNDSAYVWPVRGSSVRTADNCAATLSSTDLSIHIPIVTFYGTAYWADFQYVPNTLDFNLTNAGVISDTSPFSACTPATLSNDLLFHLPVIMFNGVSFWADLQYSHDVTVTLVGAGQN